MPRFPATAVVSAALVLGLRLTATAGEAPAAYSVREWHVRDGLPSDEITQVLQEREGHLLIATTGGLVRFDGTRFEALPIGSAAGRTPPVVRALVETRDLGIVVAMGSGEVLAGRDGKFAPPPFAGELRGRVVTALFAEPGGALWAGCADGTVLRHGADGTQVFSVTSTLPGGRRPGFATDGTGRVWVVFGETLLRHAPGGLVPAGLDFGGGELRIASSRGQGPWVVTPERVYRVEGERAAAVAEVPPLVGAHYVQTALEDRQGVLWLGTRSRGLHWISGGVLAHATGSHDDIYALGEDREGNVWAGTNGAGLNRLRPKTYRLYDKTAGLLVDFSTTVCEDGAGNVWFANRDGGIVRLRDGALQAYDTIPDWPSYSAVAVFPLHEGGVGFTCGSGVYRIGPAVGAVPEKFPGVPLLPIVRNAFVARNGDLWLSVTPGKIGRLRGGEFAIFGEAEGFNGGEVRAIAEDAAGGILVGTAGGKLLRLEGARFARLPLGEADRGAAIQAILVEPSGLVWLGTEGAGVIALEAGRARRCDATHGLSHDNVTQILADDHGHLWFGSAGGVFRADRGELLACLRGHTPRVHAITVGKDDGLKELSCLGLFQPGAWKGRDGRLWFATRRGVLTLDPALALATPSAPVAKIGRVRRDDTEVNAARPLRLGTDVRKLEIEFSALCLATPERVQLRYRLDGFDADWIVAGVGRAAVYPQLPAGEYRFRVVARVPGEASAESADELAFTVVPPWWQAWWFRAAALVALAVAVGLAARSWSHRRLRAKLDKLERESAVERERTRIARNIHDDLGAGLTRISLLTQSAGQAGGGAAQFEKIYTTVSELTRSMDEIVWAVNPKNDDLDSLAYYLGNFAQGFLADAGIRCRLLVPDHLPRRPLTSQMRHHLFLCCKEALHNVVKHARASAASFALEVRIDELRITLADDGRGLAAAPATRAGNGLVNMRARMAELGGACEIAAGAGGGTVVTFSVILPPP